MKKTLWIITIALSILLAVALPISFILHPTIGILSTKTKLLLSNQLYMSSFYIHVILGGIALLIGWVGFVDKIRKKYLKFHRMSGKAYVVCFSITAFTSILVSYNAYGGIVSQLGFMSVGIIALFTTIKGFITIRNKQIIAHQTWMRYSFACCLSTITLRIWSPILSVISQDEILTYQIVSWLSWIPNLVVAYWISSQKKVPKEFPFLTQSQ